MAINAPAPKAFAGPDKIYTSWRNNLAVGGYDVVSFYQGNPVQGRSKLFVNWKGARWQFSTNANLETFMAEPNKYEPAYGGYCAWALAHNKLAKGKPKHWTIQDGRLFLNFNRQIKNRWLENIDAFIIEGDKYWPQVLD